MRKHLNRCLCIVRCVKSKAPGRDESLPYELTATGIWRRVAGRACPAPTRGVDGEMRDGGRFRRGVGTPPSGRRGGLRRREVPGGMKPSPMKCPQKGYGVRLRAGHARPLRGGDGEDGTWRKTGRWCLHNFAAGLII